jgi:hypothetical protein
MHFIARQLSNTTLQALLLIYTDELLHCFARQTSHTWLTWVIKLIICYSNSKSATQQQGDKKNTAAVFRLYSIKRIAILPGKCRAQQKNCKYLGPTGFIGMNLQILDHRSHAMWWKIIQRPKSPFSHFALRP